VKRSGVNERIYHPVNFGDQYLQIAAQHVKGWVQP